MDSRHSWRSPFIRPFAQLENRLHRHPGRTLELFGSHWFVGAGPPFVEATVFNNTFHHGFQFAQRVLRLMSRMICSDDDARPAGLCFISTPQVRMNKNTPLNQNYICPIGADGIHDLQVRGRKYIDRAQCVASQDDLNRA